MPSDGPKLELAYPPGTVSAEEATAIVAALERFMRATAPALPASEPDHDPWQRAALLEGVAREPGGLSPWGDAHPWL